MAGAIELALPEGDYETVAGYLIDRLGRIPAVGAAVQVDGFELVAHRVDGHRVAQVLARDLRETVDPGEQP